MNIKLILKYNTEAELCQEKHIFGMHVEKVRYLRRKKESGIIPLREREKKMKYARQLLIILLISFIGELLRYLIPISIPASIYGMLLLFLALEFKIMKLSDVKDISSFLIELMPIMFVPAGVGLLNSWSVLQPVWIQIVIITIVSTVIVMGVSGLVTQLVIRIKGKKKQKESHN